MSVIQAAPRGVAGTTRKNSEGPFSTRWTTASSNSSDAAVRLATTRTRDFSLTETSSSTCLLVEVTPASVRRQLRVPVAQHAERVPELALGVLLVERGVDVRHVQRVDRGRELLRRPGLGRHRSAQRQLQR